MEAQRVHSTAGSVVSGLNVSQEARIKYRLAEILGILVRRIESKKVVLLLKDATSPGLLKPYEHLPDDRYLNVIMPMRV